MGMKSPAFCNPSTFFMKCMNPEGLLVENMQKTNNYNIELTHEIKQEFKIRMEKMVSYYKSSQNFKDITPNNNLELPQYNDRNNVGWIKQFSQIWMRGLKNEMRNPMDVKMRFVETIFMALMIIIAFNGVEFYFLKNLIKLF